MGILDLFGKKKCSICDKKQRAYLPIDTNFEKQLINSGYKFYGKNEHFNPREYLCSGCQSTDRDRMYASFFKVIIPQKYPAGFDLLHIAPAWELNNRVLKKFSGARITTFDLAMKGVDVYGNVEQMPFPENKFDIIVFSHVLEHVQNPEKALSEIYRVLKPGGISIIMAPVIAELEHTLEDPAHTSAADRLKNYGQEDHLRLFAKKDFVNRISTAGFKVEEYDKNYFGQQEFNELGLKDSSVLYVGRK